MKKIFTLICAALVGVGMYAAQTVVTFNSTDFHSGTSCKKDGVTIKFTGFDDVDAYITGPISFSTELGNFIKIEIQAFGAYVTGDGWTGDNNKKTWTGSASTVQSTGNISKPGKITCTIEVTPTAIDEVTGYGLPVTGKVLRDGQLFIVRDGKIYTITGAEIR